MSMTRQDVENHAIYEALPEHIRWKIDAAYDAATAELVKIRNFRPNQADLAESLVAAIAKYFVESNKP